MKKYILVRREGDDNTTIRAVGGVYSSPLSAAKAAGADLVENSAAPWEKASGYAESLAGRPVGTTQLDPTTGLRYRILVADFTSNRRPITPGLRVLDYDRREGVVLPGQFMDDGLISPGGEFFNSWYDVLPDGRTGRGTPFNGERMQAL